MVNICVCLIFNPGNININIINMLMRLVGEERRVILMRMYLSQLLLICHADCTYALQRTLHCGSAIFFDQQKKVLNSDEINNFHLESC